jgi:DDE superfamily endonuclease
MVFISQTTSTMDNDDDDPLLPHHILGTTSTNNKRRRFTIQEKMSLVRAIRRKVEMCQVSLRKACIDANIHHKQYLTWTDQIATMSDAKNIKAKSSCAGRESILKVIEADLLRFIFELREQGMGVTTTMVILKAASLNRSFREKSRQAQYHAARRFILTNGLVHRMATHESQRDPRETAAEALDFIATIRPRLSQPCRHQDYILNMDQTPIPFSFDSKKTLEVVGRRTIHVRKSTNDTKRATYAMTVTASGKALTPLLVFKGKPGGRIEKREFPTYPAGVVYACQENAWMDESVMLLWVERVLKPYVSESPDHIVPLLFLDSYRCHMMDSVVQQIQDLGVEVEHIPGGCTGLCQPVDVGVNKPFKNRIRAQWESWMLEEGLSNGTTSPPSREDVSRWTVAAMDTLTEGIIQNAWRHGEYSWFIEQQEQQEQEHGDHHQEQQGVQQQVLPEEQEQEDEEQRSAQQEEMFLL